MNDLEVLHEIATTLRMWIRESSRDEDFQISVEVVDADPYLSLSIGDTMVWDSEGNGVAQMIDDDPECEATVLERAHQKPSLFMDAWRSDIRILMRVAGIVDGGDMPRRA